MISEQDKIARVIGKAAGEKFVRSQEIVGAKVIAALAKNGYRVSPTPPGGSDE